MRRLLVLPLTLLIAAGAVAAPDKKSDAAEAKGKAKAAEGWLSLANLLAGKGVKADAQAALDRAKTLSADLPGLPKAAEAVAALADGGTLDAEGQKAVEKAQKDLAKHYDKLADLFADGSDARFGGYLLEAVDLDPSKGRVQRLADAAKKSPLLLRSPKHPLAAWVSLPGGWKAGKTWPVFVTCEGAGANFRGNHDGFRSARGSREVILVTPFALSATNALQQDKFPMYPADLLKANEAQGSRVDFDNAGLAAVLAVVRERFGGAPKVSITGFSGGGMLCYSYTLRHPEEVAMCAPACPNFHEGLGQGVPEAKDGGPKVRIFTGEKDEHREHVFGQRPGIEGQTDLAVQAFERLGYKDVKRTMLPGVGHSSCVAQVWAAVDEVLGSK